MIVLFSYTICEALTVFPTYPDDIITFSAIAIWFFICVLEAVDDNRERRREEGVVLEFS